MRLSETLQLLRTARPPAPYGAWTLARCYSIEDVAKRVRANGSGRPVICPSPRQLV